MPLSRALGEIALVGFLVGGTFPLGHAESDPAACVQEIQGVCVHLEDKLETCLTERGDQLSANCRDQLKTALDLMKNPSGPAACIPDVQRLCPDLAAEALSRCITDRQKDFSEACQKYLQTTTPRSSDN